MENFLTHMHQLGMARPAKKSLAATSDGGIGGYKPKQIQTTNK